MIRPAALNEDLPADTWRRIDEVFEGALELPTTQQAPYLEQRCAGDRVLRDKVELLLDADRRAESFLETPHEGASTLSDTARLVHRDPRRLGTYRLLREIGRGGMGTVYLAARDDDHYRRLVAVKLMRHEAHRGGPGSAYRDELRQRFHRERQILADLEHPHIARLYDGGTADDGRPFLVMEYVDGVPIDRYCQRQSLTLRQRLELFCEVCAAVQHAHRSLLVHRDLKPSNVLVTDEGRPVLLDFGIAKLLVPEPAGGSPKTRTGVRLMTPGYASPEQVRGASITTASDVYALGVVLYELLTGRSPYRTTDELPHELERAVCEQEPIRPSLVTQRSPRRFGRAAGRRSQLAGDLDAIVLQALRKEPTARYGSVEQLIDDLRRFLEGRPISVRRSSRRYRAVKFLRRYALAVSAAATVLVLVAVFLITLLAQARRLDMQHRIAESERAVASRERDKAQQALDFLVDVFAVAEPEQARGETVTARQILEAGAARVRQDLTGQAEVQATLMDAIGRAYWSLGLTEQASPLLEEALGLRRSAHGLAHPEVAMSLGHLAGLREDEGQYQEAEAIYRQALAMQTDLFGSHDPRLVPTLHGMMDVDLRLSRFDQAEDRARQALEILRQHHAADDLRMAVGLDALAEVLRRQGDLPRTADLYRQALALRRRDLPERHPDILNNLANLGTVLSLAGQATEAVALSRETLTLARVVYGPEHPEVLTMLHNLAQMLFEAGDLEASEAAHREVLALRRAHHGKTHPVVAVTLNNLAAVLEMEGELEQALALHRQALAIRRAAFGEHHHAVANSLCGMGTVQRRAGRLAEAESHHRQCLGILRRLRGEQHPVVSHALDALGKTLIERGELQTAMALLQQSLAIRQAAFAEGHWRIAQSQQAIGWCLTAMDRFAEAEPLLRHSHRQVAERFSPEHPSFQESARRLTELYDAWDRPGLAHQVRADLIGEQQ
ncbi:MAG: serine/threonine-protein kinase [Acidobacteriota bacterium]